MQVGSLKELAGRSSILFITVTDSAALEEVTMGENGLISGMNPGSIIIDMSTVSPESSMKVNEAIELAESKFLRAPVTGSTAFAASGTLGILSSGDRTSYDSVLKLFQKLGNKQFYLGTGEEAWYMKLVINMMLGTSMQMLAESLALGERVGLDWAQMIEIIAGSAVGSPLINYKVNGLTARNYDALNIRLMEKDFHLALNVARNMDVALPISAMTRQLLASARSTGKGDYDISALVLLAEDMSGIRN
ncbi:NAD(P)-dependent oxidoreductase [Desulfosporosinus sp. SYSU MS00001]|uniref:NAD(P)-dependent oxidoreductase n=1 Tax=Desulfosporosinus sp. SYSU MS00001 TaxID=3416284 RepID=UPI003CE9AFB4